MAETFVFKNEEEKKGAIIQALNQLKGTMGWKVIVKAMEENMRKTELKMFGKLKWDEDETLRSLQDLHDACERLRDMPDDLITQYKDKEVFPPNLDPYF